MEIPDYERRRVGDDPWAPFRSPTMIGCALAVNKNYFFRIGGFDEGMNIWGGENLELAFRNWMCGGGVLTVPCSRVGHVFKPFAYSFDGDLEKTVEKNLMRVAELWMDDYKKYFYASTYSWVTKHTNLAPEELGTLRGLIQFKRQHLQCKPFDWYLRTIIPELPVPPLTAHWYGEVTNVRSEQCWFIAPDGYIIMTTNCYHHRIHPEHIVHIDHQGRMFYEDRCVHVDPTTFLVRVESCASPQTPTRWRVLRDGSNTGLLRADFEFQGRPHSMCIVQVSNVLSVHGGEQVPQCTEECDSKNEFQHWRFTYKFDFHYNFHMPNL